MGYGDYSILTDKTQGHTNNYYIDKFRNIEDFAKGPPQTLDDALLGRNIKGGVLVPTEGIPQLEDTPEIRIDMDNAVPDPRVAESEGAMYPWDINYKDPKFAPETYADIDDPEVADTALSQFRASVWKDRQASLTAMDFGATARVNRIIDGLDETYMLTLDGQLDVEYAKLQKVSYPMSFTPYGEPETTIPGKPYLGSVGALDLIEKPGESFAFWKTKTENPPTFKKPAGSELPELPYNTAAPVDAMIEAQESRDIIPKADD